jgi:hypothetical protein
LYFYLDITDICTASFLSKSGQDRSLRSAFLPRRVPLRRVNDLPQIAGRSGTTFHGVALAHSWIINLLHQSYFQQDMGSGLIR